MPIQYSVDSERRLLQIAYIGPVTKEEIIEHRQQMEYDPRGIAGFDALIDLRYGSTALTADDIRELALFARRQSWPRSRRALVTPHPASLGNMRMFGMLAEPGPRHYQAFKTLKEACTWLGIELNGDEDG